MLVGHGITKPGIINLSSNAIGCYGAKKILSLLISFKLEMSTIKLFDNKVGEIGAIAVAKYIKWMKQPVVEISMSHNNVSAAGAAHIILSICDHPGKAYPYWNDVTMQWVPALLRLDENLIRCAASMMNLMSTFEYNEIIRYDVTDSVDRYVSTSGRPKDEKPTCAHVALFLPWQQKKGSLVDPEWDFVCCKAVMEAHRQKKRLPSDYTMVAETAVADAQ